MGEYLATFENIAKHLELNTELEIKILPDLPQYNYIQSAMMNIQHNSFVRETRTFKIKYLSGQTNVCLKLL